MMLSQEQNDLLCSTVVGKPMGDMLRQYWVPAVRAARLESDGAPVRVRLFGENYIAFRATDGRIGFFDEGCPHRGVSLALARNEDCALTCIFHGWKIDVSGKVVDVPSEPSERKSFGDKVRVRHYPVHEAGGVVWVWLGKGEEPSFPMFEFTKLPVDHIFVQAAVIECNWVQVLEGVLDSAHVGILHKAWINPQVPGNLSQVLADSAPRYELELRPYGFQAAAVRRKQDGSTYTRITEYVAPWTVFIPLGLQNNAIAIISVPIDDTHTTQWYITYNRAQPIASDPGLTMQTGSVDNPDNIYMTGGFPTVWEQNREAMAAGHFTGLRGIVFEDLVVAESQGHITDRTKEHLGSSDMALIRMRRLLFESVQHFHQGKAPLGLSENIPYDTIHARDMILPPGESWREAEKQHR